MTPPKIKQRIFEALIDHSELNPGDYLEATYTSAQEQKEDYGCFLEDVIMNAVDTSFLLVPDREGGTEELCLENCYIIDIYPGQHSLKFNICAGGDWQEPHFFTLAVTIDPITSELKCITTNLFEDHCMGDCDESQARIYNFFKTEVSNYTPTLTKSPSGAHQDGGQTLIIFK